MKKQRPGKTVPEKRMRQAAARTGGMALTSSHDPYTEIAGVDGGPFIEKAGSCRLIPIPRGGGLAPVTHSCTNEEKNKIRVGPCCRIASENSKGKSISVDINQSSEMAPMRSASDQHRDPREKKNTRGEKKEEVFSPSTD